ncbi:MAG: hypothetical protein ABW252_06145 [Polyangiales bacterium]
MSGATIARVSHWLSNSLRTRGGVFAPVAERFLVEWLGDDARSYPGGARGLVGLCGRMEHWLALDDVDEEGERRFVEGAGALLGLLLIEHVGDARHVARGAVHRVQLGTHGFFDPFAAIDRALDADDVRSELARQVGVAEAEARSEGPVSRVALALLAAVARERPDLRLEDHFDLSLSLRGGARDETLEIDLRRAVESTRDQGTEAVTRVAGKLLTMLPGGAETRLALAEIRERLVPRLARRDVLRELSSGEAGALHAAPLTDELAIALMLEYQGRARYVRLDELRTWELTEDAALALARDNLAARSSEARIGGIETEHGTLLVARTGDGRDSARVLLRGLYRALAARLGADVYVGIPHRDTFFACGAGQPKLLEELARRTARDAERAPHKLSARIFRLTDKGLRGLD